MKSSFYKTITAVLLSNMLFFFSLALATETHISKQSNEPAKPNIAIKRASEAPSSSIQPNVQNGELLVWAYQVTNTGNVELQNVQVTDDKIGTIDCPQEALTVGESMTCAGYGSGQSSQYNHKGCATGDHIIINNIGVLVTTPGDCDSGA